MTAKIEESTAIVNGARMTQKSIYVTKTSRPQKQTKIIIFFKFFKVTLEVLNISKKLGLCVFKSVSIWQPFKKTCWVQLRVYSEFVIELV
jgi:hypothetical protein